VYPVSPVLEQGHSGSTSHGTKKNPFRPIPVVVKSLHPPFHHISISGIFTMASFTTVSSDIRCCARRDLADATFISQPINAQATRAPPTFKQLLSHAFREPHPIEFKPVVYRSHARPSLAHYGMRAVRPTLLWAGFMTCILGWPLAAKALVQMSNGVYGYKWVSKRQKDSSVQ